MLFMNLFFFMQIYSLLDLRVQLLLRKIVTHGSPTLVKCDNTAFPGQKPSEIHWKFFIFYCIQITRRLAHTTSHLDTILPAY